MSRKTTYKLLVAAVVVFIFMIFLALGFNTEIEVTEYDVISSNLPAEFDGYRILQISDYHNKDFGNNQDSLIAAATEIDPDIIVLTGDIVDGKHPDILAAQQMTEAMAKIAPVYFITGNHELYTEAQVQYDQYLHVLQENDVMHLDNATTTLQVGDATILLSGQEYVSHYVNRYLTPADSEYYNILLYHGSDNFDVIAPFGYDLVFSGHLHGGVVRLPFLGGVFGADGTLFPQYDAGIFQKDETTLIVSRGLGDATIPRFFNRPELVVVTLWHES